MAFSLHRVGVVALALFFFTSVIHADDPPAKTDSKTTESKSSTTKSTPSKFDTLTKDMKKVDGMWNLYHSEQKLYLHLKSTQLNKDYIVLSSIAKGVSVGSILGGMTWNDSLWRFKKVGKKIHVLERNVRYRAKSGSPEEKAVKLAYSDSVLYALPILTTANGGDLVDMTRIFMSDDQKIGRSLGGARFAADRSTWAKVKAYPRNVELQVAAVYSGTADIETVADPRGMQVNVHYSISELPKNSYKPRIADDRIGYFLTVIKDFSDDKDDEQFVRYINRWDLQKADAKAKLSPPKEPIIFYIEKTVPVRLRPIVRDGIEEWNKAYEKIGFSHAIEVRQQRDDDTWDPEDIRYNTFRWITSERTFAMGPSRVNPLTGQILDADIIFDASWLKYWREDFETFSGKAPKALTNVRNMVGLESPIPFGRPHHHHRHNQACRLCVGMQHQMGFSAAALLGQGLTSATGELPEEFVEQALKEVVMHEVGHTLGLRHNFKASAWKSLDEINDSEDFSTIASVMDYAPANIVAPGEKQGRYYSRTIGPYDIWAIEYGYKQIASKEEEELKKIASRCNEPGHDYATDEDTATSDPLVNRFDLGENTVDFAARQMKIATELIPKVVERSVDEGQNYTRARRAFNMLFREYWQSAQFASRYIGGVYVHRDHKGDKGARPPFVVVKAEDQREAMELLASTVLASPEYSANTLNYLAASRWRHWGTSGPTRLDYPIHQYVEREQETILNQLTHSTTLERLLDNELKVPEDEEAYTLAEHIQRITDAVFSEWKGVEKPGEYSNRKPYITGFRRNLQRSVIDKYSGLVTGKGSAPADAKTLARYHLKKLDGQITALLKNEKMKLDDYSHAHLQDMQTRIQQVLKAQMTISSDNSSGLMFLGF